MEKKDMALLIEVEDEIHNMDKALEQLAGHGHASGEFVKLDNVFNVIYHNSHEYYHDESDKNDNKSDLFFHILTSREMTPEERADILLNGTVRGM